MRGCLAQVGCLSLVVGAGVALWLARDPTSALVRGWLGRPAATVVVAIAPEVADSAESKVRRLEPGRELRLSFAEVQSWVTYRVEPALPDYVRDVRVALEDSRLRLDARIETRRVPGAESAGPLVELVGDTAEVTVVGRLDGVGAGRGAYFVERAFVGGLPVPDPLRNRLLAPLRRGARGLPPHAVPFPLPPPAWDIAVREGALVLRSGVLED